MLGVLQISRHKTCETLCAILNKQKNVQDCLCEMKQENDVRHLFTQNNCKRVLKGSGDDTLHFRFLNFWTLYILIFQMKHYVLNTSPVSKILHVFCNAD